MLDCIIIGGGPAGCSAAMYLLRAGFSVKVIAKDLGALEKAELIENYYGLQKPVSGRELIEIGRSQVKTLGGDIFCDEITGINFAKTFLISGVENNYETKSIIIATGSQRKKSAIKNSDKFEGSGVSYCAVCDAFFYKNKSVGVLGEGEYALHEVRELQNIAEKVTIFTNGKEKRAKFPEDIEVITEPIIELIGEKFLEGVKLSNGEEIKLNGFFIALGTAGASDLARTLGIQVVNGNIKVNERMETAVPGIFAAGDCIGGVAQISTAVGEGARAALSAINFLRSH